MNQEWNLEGLHFEVSFFDESTCIKASWEIFRIDILVWFFVILAFYRVKEELLYLNPFKFRLP